jgi:hypothetical protein
LKLQTLTWIQRAYPWTPKLRDKQLRKGLAKYAEDQLPQKVADDYHGDCNSKMDEDFPYCAGIPLHPDEVAQENQYSKPYSNAECGSIV